MIQRYLTALCVLALACPAGLAAGQDMRLIAPSESIQPGQESTIEITLAGAPGVAAMELDVEYDPEALRVVEVRAAEMAKDMLFDVRLTSPGVIIVNMATSGDGPMGNGALLEVDVEPLVEAGQSTPLAFTNVRAWQSSDRSELDVETVSGEIRIAGGLPLVFIAIVAGAVLLLLLLVLGRRRKVPEAPAKPTASARCPQCGTATPAGVKFCSECGAKMEAR